VRLCGVAPADRVRCVWLARVPGGALYVSAEGGPRWQGYLEKKVRRCRVARGVTSLPLYMVTRLRVRGVAAVRRRSVH
jgi:hypothetical protein